jgi:hypothetical protein
MGQKTNPTIFRLGQTEKWEHKYFEKKSTETGVQTFNNVEIKKFISKFLIDNNFILCDYKLQQNEKTDMHLFIAYFSNLTPKISENTAQEVTKKRIQYSQKEQQNTLVYKKVLHNGMLFEHDAQFNSFKYQQSIKKYYFKKNELILMQTNTFLDTIFESLNFFMDKKVNILITFQHVNKNVKKTVRKEEKKLLKKSLLRIERYKNAEFFKKGVNLLFTSTKLQSSTNLMAQFIANHLGTTQRHNFFLTFIKTTLALLIANPFSKLKGIKIKINGRLNGRPRAKHKVLLIGKGVPTLTIDSNIKYAEATSYTSKGTLGIKVWTYYKNYVKRTKTDKV